jgi:hypothetical protein
VQNFRCIFIRHFLASIRGKFMWIFVFHHRLKTGVRFSLWSRNCDLTTTLFLVRRCRLHGALPPRSSWCATSVQEQLLPLAGSFVWSDVTIMLFNL